MQRALRQTVTVKSGGLIEIRDPELAEGAAADVIIIVEAPSGAPATKLSQLIGMARGGFESSVEADEFIRRERDAWQS